MGGRAQTITQRAQRAEPPKHTNLLVHALKVFEDDGGEEVEHND